MLFIIQQLVNLIKLLHSESSDKRIAWAVVFGFFCAVSPLGSLQGIGMILIAVFLRVQFGAFVLSWLLGSLLFLLFTGLFDSVGYALLTLEPLRGVYTSLQKSDLGSLTRFHNTIVFGGFVFMICISPLVYFGAKFLIRKYRDVVVEAFQKSRLYYLIKTSFLIKIFNFYEKYKTN